VTRARLPDRRPKYCISPSARCSIYLGSYAVSEPNMHVLDPGPSVSGYCSSEEVCAREKSRLLSVGLMVQNSEGRHMRHEQGDQELIDYSLVLTCCIMLYACRTGSIGSSPPRTDGSSTHPRRPEHPPRRLNQTRVPTTRALF
jgi:hypothetical protein